MLLRTRNKAARPSWAREDHDERDTAGWVVTGWDDRLECFVGQNPALTLRRGRGQADGRHGQVIDYRHVIHSKSMVSLLALAHDRGCEAELAAALTEQLARPESANIDVAALQARSAPVPAQMPVVVNLPPVACYDLLLPSIGAAA
jgi:hypothetical protein